MSSKKVEDVHTELIKKLLKESGLVCMRSPQFSEESEEQEEEEEEEAFEEEERRAEEHVEIEQYHIPEEMIAEEFSDLFPTPSLRRIIPERVRRIEAQNRIKVLPDQFLTNIDPDEIPRIIYTAPQVYIDKLASLTGCKLFKSNLAEYWFLDTLANLLRRAQQDEFSKHSQAVLILWFCEFMKEMQHFDAASRDRMMRRWRDNMLSAAKVIAEEDIFPSPQDCGVYYKSRDTKTEAVSVSVLKSGKIATIAKSFHSEGSEFVYECALKDLSKIIHYIYDLIGTDFQYDLLRSIFTFSPEYRLIDGPFQIEVPKRLYSVLKPKKEAKAPKVKQDKAAPKGKKKEQDTEEYLALMQLIDTSRKEDMEKEELDRESWNRRNSILPLNFAATAEFFDQYWPPPPEPTPPPVPVVDDSKSAKGKKGKK